MFLQVLRDCRSVIWCICFLEISDEQMLTVANKCIIGVLEFTGSCAGTEEWQLKFLLDSSVSN